MSIEVSATTSVVPSQLAPSSAPSRPLATGSAPSPADRLERRPVTLAAANNPGLTLEPPKAGAAAASGPRFPRNLCYRGACGVEMERIWNAFNAAGPVDLGRVPHVFSGNTYFLASGYDVNHAHHGGLLLDRQPDGALTFNARWSFFTPTNPYTGATLDEARTWSRTHYPVQDRGDHLYIDLTDHSQPHAVPVEYWLREDATKHTLYVVGFFGNGQFAVGELKPNE